MSVDKMGEGRGERGHFKHISNPESNRIAFENSMGYTL